MPQLFNFYRFLLPGCFIKKFYRTLQRLNKKIPCLSTEFTLFIVESFLQYYRLLAEKGNA